jgi:hypothetical protein
MTKQGIIDRSLSELCEAERRLSGLYAKSENIYRKHGRVPLAVEAEISDAECERGYLLTIYKDNKHDPYL